MTYQDDVIGKLVITYEDQNNDKFTETPFYIHGNPMQSEGAGRSINRRIYAAMAQMDTLALNTNISAKVVYEFDLVLPE